MSNHASPLSLEARTHKCIECYRISPNTFGPRLSKLAFPGGSEKIEDAMDVRPSFLNDVVTLALSALKLGHHDMLASAKPDSTAVGGLGAAHYTTPGGLEASCKRLCVA